MRYALRSLAATAKAQHLSFDTNGFYVSLKHYAAAAARCDFATARGASRIDPQLELEAARSVDLAAYGIDGGTAVTFPDVARALHDGSQATADLAVARARTTLERAAQLIAR
jgi:hypothetical protein